MINSMKLRVSGYVLKTFEKQDKEKKTVKVGCHFYTDDGDFCSISNVPADFQNLKQFEHIDYVPIKIDVYEGRQYVTFDHYAN